MCLLFFPACTDLLAQHQLVHLIQYEQKVAKTVSSNVQVLNKIRQKQPRWFEHQEMFFVVVLLLLYFWVLLKCKIHVARSLWSRVHNSINIEWFQSYPPLQSQTIQLLEKPCLLFGWLVAKITRRWHKGTAWHFSLSWFITPCQNVQIIIVLFCKI